MKKIYLDVDNTKRFDVVGSQEFFALAKLLWKLGVYDWLAVRNADDHAQVVILFNNASHPPTNHVKIQVLMDFLHKLGVITEAQRMDVLIRTWPDTGDIVS